MPKLPIVTVKIVISTLEKIGFQVARQKGSHVQMEYEDGRFVTIPVHSGKTIGRGLLRYAMLNLQQTSLSHC